MQKASWSKEHVHFDVSFGIKEVLFEGKTDIHEVLIADTYAFGKGLFLNGIPQSFEVDQELYHGALIHPAMLLHPSPRKVLLAGGGEGCSLKEILRHKEVEQVTMVDIDTELISICKQHLVDWHDQAFDDPRVSIQQGDITEFVTSLGDDSFDVAFFDLGDPLEDGPSRNAFCAEFYQDVSRIVGTTGLASLQAGELDLKKSFSFRAIRDTIQSQFTKACWYTTAIPSYAGYWGFVLAGNQDFSHQVEDLSRVWEKRGYRNWRSFSPGYYQHLTSWSPYLLEKFRQPGRILSLQQPLTCQDFEREES